MSGSIFAGLRVIDCASFIAAPAAAVVLADFGAEVIKVEPPEGGDPLRSLASIPGLPACARNYAWMLDGRGKRSLALDLKRAEGREALHALARSADVFITNLPLPTRPLLGIDAATVTALNDRLIYASFTAYGEQGEEAHRTGFDSTAYWARSGLMDTVRADAGANPARSAPGMGDHPSAMALYGAIVTALYRRERSGRGGVVSSSLIANGVWANGTLVQAQLCGATFVDRRPREVALNACTNNYRTRDGHWFILAVVNEARQWPGLLQAIGRPALGEDPRFATMAARRANAPALIAAFDQAFAGDDFHAWRRRLDTHGVTYGPVAKMGDLLEDGQMRASGALLPLADGTLTVDSPIHVEGATKTPPGPAPGLGADSEAVLREAGYDATGIAALRRDGVIN